MGKVNPVITLVPCSAEKGMLAQQHSPLYMQSYWTIQLENGKVIGNQVEMSQYPCALQDVEMLVTVIFCGISD